jgi:hypothetical protein
MSSVVGGVIRVQLAVDWIIDALYPLHDLPLPASFDVVQAAPKQALLHQRGTLGTR